MFLNVIGIVTTASFLFFGEGEEVLVSEPSGAILRG
jgi:hypothetical protein